MRKKLLLWELGGFVFVAVLGTLFHFVYDWSGENAAAAAFTAVNESTWEHMKLLFFPLFLFSIIQLWAMGRNYSNFLSVRALSALVGLTLIPVLFYTYTGVLGRMITWVNVAIFYVADAALFLLDYALLRRGRAASFPRQMAGLLTLWALAFLFVWFTFRTPQIGLFLDPVTGRYGLAA